MKRPGPRENAVMSAVDAYLTCRGDVYHWRNNVGTFEVRSGEWVKFSVKGSADWLGIIAPSGKLIAIECKRPVGGVLSQEQKEFRDRVQEAGGIWVLATSIADVEAALPPVTKKLTTLFQRVIAR